MVLWIACADLLGRPPKPTKWSKFLDGVAFVLLMLLYLSFAFMLLWCLVKLF